MASAADPARSDLPPAAPQFREAAPADWLAAMDAVGAEAGAHLRLGPRHGALLTEGGAEVLLFTLEDATEIRADAPRALPLGHAIARAEGWSQLCLYSEGRSWFRDAAVHDAMDRLIDAGFFDRFDRVVVHGAGPAGLAAAALSVAAPGATVLLSRPQATRDPRLAGWDRRWPEGRRLPVAGRFADAPGLLEAAARAFVIFDPHVTEDAMHAALLAGVAEPLRVPHLGPAPERDLHRMEALVPLLRLAAQGRLDAAAFARVWRGRRRHAAYLRRVLAATERRGGARLQELWCRAALAVADDPELHRGHAAARARRRGGPPL